MDISATVQLSEQGLEVGFNPDTLEDTLAVVEAIISMESEVQSIGSQRVQVNSYWGEPFTYGVTIYMDMGNVPFDQVSAWFDAISAAVADI